MLTGRIITETCLGLMSQLLLPNREDNGRHPIGPPLLELRCSQAREQVEDSLLIQGTRR